jgi:glycosyltransferase involved in cell wall biosynthesis
MDIPLISVILPVYNGAAYLRDAIDSILAQTFRKFELIVIDDGSTDSSMDILQQYTDDRIRLFSHPNQGLAATLNCGIELTRGRYVARQDQDDISRPERFTQQIAYLESHPACALLGTWAEIKQARKFSRMFHRHPTDNATLQFELLFNNPFVHSSVMIRKAALENVGVYSTDPTRQPPEDYELWSRIARHYEVANLPKILQIYREVRGSMSRVGPSPFLERLIKICAENIAWATDGDWDDPLIQNIALLTHTKQVQTLDFLQGQPDFHTMREILYRAVSRISPPEKRNRFLKKADQHLSDIRFLYLRQQYKASGIKYFWLKTVYRSKKMFRL